MNGTKTPLDSGFSRGSTPRPLDWLPLPTLLGFIVAALTILVTAWFSWRSQQWQSESADAMVEMRAATPEH